jgi:hypothetical protein
MRSYAIKKVDWDIPTLLGKLESLSPTFYPLKGKVRSILLDFTWLAKIASKDLPI